MNMPRSEREWLRRVQQVIRSRHYAWIAEARDGDPMNDVMTDLATDIMHICKRTGITWDELLRQSRRKFEEEEAALEMVPA